MTAGSKTSHKSDEGWFSRNLVPADPQSQIAPVTVIDINRKNTVQAMEIMNDLNITKHTCRTNR